MGARALQDWLPGAWLCDSSPPLPGAAPPRAGHLLWAHGLPMLAAQDPTWGLEWPGRPAPTPLPAAPPLGAALARRLLTMGKLSFWVISL